jgi:GGDEF domain-containing protein
VLRPDAGASAAIRWVRALADRLDAATGGAARGSFGVAVSEPGGLGGDALVARADAAMYEAKQRGELVRLSQPAP